MFEKKILIKENKKEQAIYSFLIRGEMCFIFIRFLIPCSFPKI